MNFFNNLFGKKDKEKENAAADSSAGFVPVVGDSEPDSSDATSTDSGGFGGGDGGGGGGGDGGGV